ncbi:aliphatic sulfonate ABC transporter substrate-binding protein [Metabacillus sediminilitoris]|uniref:Putative aliphatic sulfonates-binding protein n=1 Tax=Metabacillus sediminilitoris TaxID=2567941 RepID=A0A4S4BKN0_9BACI|nr:aliphatic sulfonate ABC transporter substrate-binding protein [Metabacillus sediminilitoris]QGQ45886.1 aliphatic sulfonate ABC transporter substrate-binding protein [Metabacillus sediminilitoris]THF75068.1 aliphatic sulfonate ABC transporter substrate-binding protein [Metabacillus sediminilitoris]
MKTIHKNWKNKVFLIFLLAVLSILSACGAGQVTSSGGESQEKTIINIGVQGKVGVLNYARNEKIFEKAFENEIVEIKWAEFTSGPPHFEAIASGRLDFGATGGTPLIAGQAGGIDFRAIGVTSDGRKNYAILARKDATFKSIEDIKGKKVAVAPGSGSSNFLFAALDKNGLSAKDIEIVPLQPDEARAAFENGSVDVWAIWEPYLTTAIHQLGAVPILTSEDINLLSPGFLISRTGFTEEHPEYTELFLKAYEDARKEYDENIETISKELAEVQGVDEKIILEVNEKTESILSPTTDEFAKAQQEQADFLYEEGVIDKKIDISKVIDNTFVDNALK